MTRLEKRECEIMNNNQQPDLDLLDKKLEGAFAYVKDSTLRQLEHLLKKGQPIPPELKIEFTVRLV
jgi:hypothetical protein